MKCGTIQRLRTGKQLAILRESTTTIMTTPMRCGMNFAKRGKIDQVKEETTMKYIIWDERKDGQFFTEEYDSKEEAIRNADLEWSRYKTDWEKKQTIAFFVLESENPDEDADNHYDGNPVKVYKETKE